MDDITRKNLSQDLRRLVTGRMTNDDFDEVYEKCLVSSDLAVQAIAEFGYGLYSSDCQIPYCLNGRHKVSSTIRRTAARCVLFLNSKLPYEWPRKFEITAAESLGSGLAWLGIPIGVILLSIGLPYRLLGERDVEFWRLMVLIGATALAASSAYLVGIAKICRARQQRWELAGEFDVWPFLRRDQFEVARRTCFLLGKK